jgi:methyl-accepting chemotaxis protein
MPSQADEGDEETALLSHSNNRGRKSSSRNCFHGAGAFLLSKYMVLILLTALAVLSIYFQMKLQDISAQLQEEKHQVNHLFDVLGVHETVIERFNSSVTNTDVIGRLTLLERNFSKTTRHIEHDLHSIQDDISKQLEQTVDELSATVQHAEDEISQQVEKVKADVEQYVRSTEDQFSLENSFMVYQLAGTFTLLSCLISMWHMTAHLRKFNQPDVQRKILAILWMSPLYAVTSWFSLVFHPAEGCLAIIKDGYESVSGK